MEFPKKKRRAFFDEDAQYDEAVGSTDSNSNADTTASIKERQKKPLPIEDVQSIIPIKEISNGMIYTEDGRYVKIIEVFPVNFVLRSIEEQDNIIYLFASWLRISPVKVQFKIITRKADSTKIVDFIRDASATEKQESVRELIEDHIDFIRNLTGREALSRRFFVILEHESNKRRQLTEEDIAEELSDAALRIQNGLRRCGCESLSFQSTDEEDYFHAEVLYQFYNRNSSHDEPLSDRVIRVTKDYMAMHGMTAGVDPYPDIPVKDYIAPRGVDFSHPDFFICDGSYTCVYIIDKDGYPTAVTGGWMSNIIEAGEGIDVDIFLRKENRAQTRDKVAQKLKLTRIKASGRSDTDTDAEEIEDAMQAAQYIKQSLANGEDFYRLYTFVTVSADSYDELERRRDMMMDYLYSRDITPRLIKMRLEDAFQVISPLLIFKNELMSFGARNVMTSGAASLFPFTSCEICDENGVVLGINRRYQSLVNVDIFNSKKYKNANIAILGTTGTGKTYLELSLALRLRLQGIQTFIISPDKSHEFKRSCDHIDGSYIRICPGSPHCINIMEIRPIVNPIAEFIDGEDAAESDSWLAQKTSQLIIFFHIICPDITNEEEQLVDDSIIKTYARFGITHENKSIYVSGTKTIKKMPLIQDLQEALSEREETRRVANILGRFVTGSLSNFNNYTNVDLDNKFIVFALDDLQGTMKAVGMFIVMDFLWGQIKRNRTERKAVLIDEGWQLLGASGDERAADFVYRIFKIIRGYCGSAVFATQDITDLFAFKDGKYGKAIISNSRIKIVLGLESQEARYVQDILQLTEHEVRSITNFERGEALICANNNKVPVYIRASTLEDELITTDPNQIRTIIQKRKHEAEFQAMRGKSSQKIGTKADKAVKDNGSAWGVKPSGRPDESELSIAAKMEIHAAEQAFDSTVDQMRAEGIFGESDTIKTERMEPFSYEDEAELDLSEADNNLDFTGNPAKNWHHDSDLDGISDADSITAPAPYEEDEFDGYSPSEF